MRGKKNKKKLIIAVTGGVLATLMMFSVMSNNNKKIQELQDKNNQLKNTAIQTVAPKPEADANLTKVVIAKIDIPVGSKISADKLDIKGFSPVDLPENVIKDSRLILGMTLMENVMANQPLTRDMISELQTKTLNIPTGMRALTIPMEYVQGMASYITVGSKIDVVLAAKTDGESNLIAQNVRILAFENTVKPGTDTTPASNTVSGITLEVPADTAPKIVDAMVKGKVQIVARNTNDEGKVVTTTKKSKSEHSSGPSLRSSLPMIPAGTSLLPPIDALNKGLGGLPAPATPPKKPQKNVEVIQANVKSQIPFDK